MNEKTANLLEFERVKEAVAAYAKSGEAAALLMAQNPLSDSDSLECLQRLVRHTVTRLESGGAEPHGSLPALGPILPKLDVERAVLPASEAFALALFIEEGEKIIKWLNFDRPQPTKAATD